MNTLNFSRRGFLRTTALAAAAAAFTPSLSFGKGVDWPIGCFNRPWLQPKPPLSHEEALKGIKEAGYKITGLLTRTDKEPFIGVDATPEYLQKLKERIKASGLIANMGALRTRASGTVQEGIKECRTQLDNAKTLDLKYVLTFGVNEPKHYDTYYKMMADAADYAQERGIKLVLKPHGGGSGAAEEILRCRAKVNRPNFKIWYDAGNIIYYTGKDPVEELKPIVEHVTGLCAKDCNGQKGDVMVQFGTGKVNFKAVFTELKKAGFNGPVMVECAAGSNYQEVTNNARANRVFLEKVFAEI